MTFHYGAYGDVLPMQDIEAIRAIMPPMYVELHLGDVVRLRKKHPCGSDEWEVVRLGADIGLVCRGCRRRILLPRGDFNKQLKAIIAPALRAD